MRAKSVASRDNLAYKVMEATTAPGAVSEKSAVKSPMKTLKPYFGDIVAGEPSQVVKDNYLVEAATYGDTERVRELLRSGANANASDNSPLRLAAANGHAESVRVLLESGADSTDHEALLEAAKSGYADVVALLANGADPETRREAVRLASEGRAQTPGVFGARHITPENGHARTIAILG